jgi:flagellar basal-body rod modification protein FlgD
VDVPAGATSVVVSITNPAGELVRQINVGAQTRGLSDFSWDGVRADGAAAAPGVYNVSAQVMANGKAQGGASVLVNARVESVTIAADQSGLTLSLEGLGDIAFSDVRQIR